MPTSSQALVWLRQFTDYICLEDSYEPVNASPSMSSLPEVFPGKNEDNELKDLSLGFEHSQISGAMPIRPQQGDPSRPSDIERPSSCVTLPPISTSPGQHISLVLRTSRETEPASHDGKQHPEIHRREEYLTNIADDNESRLSTLSGNQLVDKSNDVTRRAGEKEYGINSAVFFEDMSLGANVKKGTDFRTERCNQYEAMKRSLSEHPTVSTSENIDLVCEASTKQNWMGSSPYYEDLDGIAGWSFTKSIANKNMEYLADFDMTPENCITNGQPQQNSLLSVNEHGEICQSHEDNTSCLGILSYNHQMRRHVWNLVPQNIIAPRRILRGKYIQRRSSGDSFKTNYPFDNLKQFGKSDQVAGFLNVLPCDFAKEHRNRECSRDTGQHGMREAKVGDVCGNTHDLSSYDEFPGMYQSWRKRRGIVSSHLNDSFSHRRLYDNLQSTGVIDNECYLFKESDNDQEEPRFLETLISAPKPKDVVEVCQNEPRSPSPEEDYSFSNTICPPSFQRETRMAVAVNRTFTGLTPTQKEKARSKVRTNILDSRIVNETPRETTWEFLQEKVGFLKHDSLDAHRTNAEGGHKLTGDEESTPLIESNSSVFALSEPKVVCMRSELPPSHPNRLCFRTSLSVCTHAEVIHEIETQKQVKVIWHQYEPISLHFLEVSGPDYRHVCRWLFELSPDSDPSGLLLEGFKLRGHRMNVLHLDDVYLEEFRSFNLCNEIYMEQRSKSLLKHKQKRLLKSARIISH